MSKLVEEILGEAAQKWAIRRRDQGWARVTRSGDAELHNAGEDVTKAAQLRRIQIVRILKNVALLVLAIAAAAALGKYGIGLDGAGESRNFAW
jgi:hypothetical protein